MSCHVCALPALGPAGCCQAIAYCSQNCANTHWDLAHKYHCKLLGVKRDRDEQPLDEIIESGDIEKVKAFLELNQVLPKDLPVHKAKTVEMARYLVFERGADPYQYVGGGQVALDYMVAHYPIREFLQEAREETPPGIQQWVDERDARTKPGESSFYELDYPNLNGFRHMIYHGFVPVFHERVEYDRGQDIRLAMEHLFFRRYNIETLSFWSNGRLNYQTIFGNVVRFRYNLQEDLLAEARSKNTSFPFFLFQPDQLYGASHRIKTAMDIFRGRLSRRRADITPNVHVFPVTRYAQDAMGGLYYKKPTTTEKYCGTFYYFEPESSVLLGTTGNVLYAINKTDAMQKLDPQPHGPGRGSSSLLMTEIVKTKLLYTPKDYVERFQHTRWQLHQPLDTPGLQLDRQYYCVDLLGLYADEDGLDQPLCELASKMGYDIVVLEYMPGSRQVVSEILDTRPRGESIASLYFPD